MEYTLIRAKRKSISLRVDNNGELIVRAPLRCSRDEVAKFILSKTAWIEKQKQRIAEIKAETTMLTPEEVKELVTKAREVIPPKVDHYAGILGVEVSKVSIRSPRTRWGSCSSKGNLNFNCLLMKCPPQCIDYVVIHELCHRKHMDHSRAFWDEVANIMPDYALHRGWLKKHGVKLLMSLPV